MVGWVENGNNNIKSNCMSFTKDIPTILRELEIKEYTTQLKYSWLLLY